MNYPKPSVTVDIVCLRPVKDPYKIALIRRAYPPFVGEWALPGGFVEIDEDLEPAARRELAEETQLTPVFIEQFYCFGTPHRDPRGRTISIGYLALIDHTQTGQAGDDAKELAWFNFNQLPSLAFDHANVIRKAFQVLQDWQKLGRL